MSIDRRNPEQLRATPGCGREEVSAGIELLEHPGAELAELTIRRQQRGAQRLKIHTPLVNLTKCGTIARGLELGVDYALTHSCYDPNPDGRAWGSGDSCLPRGGGFAELGLTDPALEPVGSAL